MNNVPTIEAIIEKKIHCAIQMPFDDESAYCDFKRYIEYGDNFYLQREEDGESYCLYFRDGKHSGWDYTRDAIMRDIPIYHCYDVLKILYFDVAPTKRYSKNEYVFDTQYQAYGYIINSAYYENTWHYYIEYVKPVDDHWGGEIIGNVATESKIERVEFANDDFFTSVKESIKKSLSNDTRKEIITMGFDYVVTEGSRIDKSNNTRIPTKTTSVWLTSTGRSGSATCDAENYDARTGLLNAIANAACNGNFDKEYEKILKREKNAHKWLCTCGVCGKVWESKEEADACEMKHIENKKARRQRYLERKEARDRIAAAEREGRINELMQQMLEDAEDKK